MPPAPAAAKPLQELLAADVEVLLDAHVGELLDIGARVLHAALLNEHRWEE
jgi:hypothetical protein